MRKIRNLFLTLALSAAACGLCRAQEQPSRQDILSDFDYYIARLEEIHPEPYKPLGGKAAFRRKADSLRRALAASGSLGPQDLVAGAAKFMASFRDGHSYLGRASLAHQEDGQWHFLPFSVCIMDTCLVVSASAAGPGILGARINAAGGCTIKAISDTISRLSTSENKFGLLRQTGQSILQRSFWRDVMNMDGDSLALSLTLASGADTLAAFPFVTGSQTKDSAIHRLGSDPRFSQKNLSYKFADSAKSVMVFRISATFSRDCLESMRSAGGSQWQDALREQWAGFFDSGMPANADSALKMIPSITTQFAQMLREMKACGAQTLIIDLRDNYGGWTPIISPMLYEMYGDDYLRKDFHTTFKIRVSQQYLGKSRTTLQQLSQEYGRKIKTGDIIERKVGGAAFIDSNSRKAIVGSYMSCDKDLLLGLGGSPIYRPSHVYAVTNENTFSAAFHAAFYLAEMGATLAGTPSSQAPNTYMEITQFQLPKTGIVCSVSNSKQEMFPDSDFRERVLWSGISTSYQDYKAHGFDLCTPLLQILEIAGKQGK